MGSDYQREVKQDVKTSYEKEYLNDLKKLIINLETYIKNRSNKPSETLKPIETYNVGRKEDDYYRIEKYDSKGSSDNPYPYEDSYITYDIKKLESPRESIRLF